MNFKVGDKVRYFNFGPEGVVKKIKGSILFIIWGDNKLLNQHNDYEIQLIVEPNELLKELL